jgi:hypothetical protein
MCGEPLLQVTYLECLFLHRVSLFVPLGAPCPSFNLLRNSPRKLRKHGVVWSKRSGRVAQLRECTRTATPRWSQKAPTPEEELRTRDYSIRIFIHSTPESINYFYRSLTSLRDVTSAGGRQQPKAMGFSIVVDVWMCGPGNQQISAVGAELNQRCKVILVRRSSPPICNMPKSHLTMYL